MNGRGLHWLRWKSWAIVSLNSSIDFRGVGPATLAGTPPRRARPDSCASSASLLLERLHPYNELPSLTVVWAYSLPSPLESLPIPIYPLMEHPWIAVCDSSAAKREEYRDPAPLLLLIRMVYSRRFHLRQRQTASSMICDMVQKSD